MVGDVLMNELARLLAHLLVGGLVGERQEEVRVEQVVDLPCGRQRPVAFVCLGDHPHDVVHGVAVAELGLDRRHEAELVAQQVASWAGVERGQLAVGDREFGGSCRPCPRPASAGPRSRKLGGRRRSTADGIAGPAALLPCMTREQDPVAGPRERDVEEPALVGVGALVARASNMPRGQQPVLAPGRTCSRGTRPPATAGRRPATRGPSRRGRCRGRRRRRQRSSSPSKSS